jgi:hypothetical protein
MESGRSDNQIGLREGARSNMPRSASVRATIVESSPLQISDFQTSGGTFAIRPASLAPASPIVDRPRVRIVQSLKSALAMLFDEEPHLFDGLQDLGRFRAAAPVDPLRENQGRSPRPDSESFIGHLRATDCNQADMNPPRRAPNWHRCVPWAAAAIRRSF